MRGALEDAARGLVEREVLVELVALAAVAREHLLVVGPPGTAKSEAVRRAARAFSASYFEYLLGRFTEPSEIVGPVDLRKLREGRVEVETSGMLPEAEIAFLDEVFLGSTAILNTLLGILNERTFRRGHTSIRVPLRVCVAAANSVPADEALAAFADRFLVRAFVEPVPDPLLETLLENADTLLRDDAPRRTASLAQLDALADPARTCDLSAVRPAIAHAVRQLRAAGVTLGDRRIVKAQRLIAAAAALDGRRTADLRDLWPIVYVVPSLEASAVAREVLRETLAATSSASLRFAALDASAGPEARASVLATATAALLDAPVPEESALRAQLRARLEGAARAIDAAFAPDALPAQLAGVRERLRARIGAEDVRPEGPAEAGTAADMPGGGEAAQA